MARIARLTFISLLIPALGAAADLRIVDSSGAEVIVRNASIDYGAPLGSAVRESDGIRVQQGDGHVTVKWKDVEVLTVRDAEADSKPAERVADVRLRNGREVTAILR